MSKLYYYSIHNVDVFFAPFESKNHFFGSGKNHQIVLSRNRGMQILLVKGQLYHPGVKFPDYFQTYNEWTQLDSIEPETLNKIKHVTCAQNETILVTTNEIIFWSSINPILRKVSSWVTSVPFNKKIIQVASGKSHHLFLTSDGEVYSCGSHASCSLGIAPQESPIGFPTKVHLDVKIKEIACGSNHSVLLSDAGRVYVCGLNEYGVLGLPNLGQSSTFVLCTPLLRYTIVKIACGSQYTLVLTNEGMLIGMGRSTSGQLLVNMNRCDKPKKIKPLMNYTIKDIACSDHYVVAFTDTNTLIVWGSKIFGKENQVFTTPKEVYLDLPSQVKRIIGSPEGTWFECEESPSINSSKTLNLHQTRNISDSNISFKTPNKTNENISESLNATINSTIDFTNINTTKTPNRKFNFNRSLNESITQEVITSPTFISSLKLLNDKLQMHRPHMIQLQVNLKTLCNALTSNDESIEDCIDDCVRSSGKPKSINDLKNIALNVLKYFEASTIQDPELKINSQLVTSSIEEWSDNYMQWRKCLSELERLSINHKHSQLIKDKKLIQIAFKLQSSHEEVHVVLGVIQNQLLKLTPLFSPQRNPPMLQLVSSKSKKNTSNTITSNDIVHNFNSSQNQSNIYEYNINNNNELGFSNSQNSTKTPHRHQISITNPTSNIISRPIFTNLQNSKLMQLSKNKEDDYSIETDVDNDIVSDTGSIFSSNNGEDETILDKYQLQKFEQSLNISLTTKLIQFDHEIKSKILLYFNRITQLTKMVHASKQQKDELISLYKHYKNRTLVLSQENFELRDQLHSSNKYHSQLEVSQMEVEKRNLREKQELEQIISRINRSKSQLEEDVSSFQNHIAELKMQNEEYLYQINSLRNENELQKVEIDTYKAKYEEIKKDNEKLSSKYFSLSEAAATSQKSRNDSIQTLQLEIVTLKNKLDAQIQDHQNDLFFLYMHITNNYCGDKSNTISKNEVTVGRIQELCDTIPWGVKKELFSSLQNKLDMTETRLNESKSRVNYLLEEVKRRSDIRESVQEHIQNENLLQEEIKHLKDRNQSLNQSQRGLKEEISKLGLQHSMKDQQHKNLESKVKDLEKELVQTKKALSDIQTETNKEIQSLKENHIETLKQEKLKYKSEVRKYKSKYEKNFMESKSTLINEQKKLQETFEEELERQKKNHRSELQQTKNQHKEELRRLEDLYQKEKIIRENELQEVRKQIQTIQSLHHESLSRILDYEHTSSTVSSYIKNIPPATPITESMIRVNIKTPKESEMSSSNLRKTDLINTNVTQNQSYDPSINIQMISDRILNKTSSTNNDTNNSNNKSFNNKDIHLYDSNLRNSSNQRSSPQNLTSTPNRNIVSSSFNQSYGNQNNGYSNHNNDSFSNAFEKSILQDQRPQFTQSMMEQPSQFIWNNSFDEESLRRGTNDSIYYDPMDYNSIHDSIEDMSILLQEADRKLRARLNITPSS